MSENLREYTPTNRLLRRGEDFLDSTHSLARHVKQHWVNITTSTAFAVSIAFPMHLPNQIETGQDNLQASSVTLEHGSGGRNRFKILIIRGDATPQMSQRVKDGFFMISPLDEYKETTDIYSVDAGLDLGCSQILKACNDQTVIQVRDNAEVEVGMPIQEVIVVLKSPDPNNWRGWATSPVPSRQTQPSIDTSYAVVAIPERLRSEADKLFDATATAHEFFHSAGGYTHAWDSTNEDDLMEKPLSKPFFNSRNTQFLRELKALMPFNYDIKPVLKLTALSSLQTTASQDVAVQLNGMGFILNLQSPPGTTQFYSEVIPFNNDGAGVFDYARGDLEVHAWGEGGRRVPPPPQWYGILPDMTYTWRVRLSGLATPIVDAQGRVIRNDPRWDQREIWPGIFEPNPWYEMSMHSPKTGLEKITLVSPDIINDLTPVLTWQNGDPEIFYYEVQVSKDPDFNTDPATASAMVYWELRHGGVTNPPNSYTIPPEFPLEKGTTYFWRVRPRVQGDGAPVTWSNPGSFKTSANATVLSEGELEIITQAKKVISTEEHLKLQEQIRKEEQERMRPTAAHWRWVEQEVLTRTEIPIFGDNGEIATWISHSDNISFEAYRKEEEPVA